MVRDTFTGLKAGERLVILEPNHDIRRATDRAAQTSNALLLQR